ncbi:hypothetical protein [Nostoc sp.]|uniref:hypothetical protein n=1 Tax=Nostoc sp. TaxID=1180 RepID=UPI002FF5D83B
MGTSGSKREVRGIISPIDSTLEVVAALPEEVKNRPKLKEFVERIHERPAYKTALERGGKYDISFQ